MKKHTTKIPAAFPVRVTGEPTNITIYMEHHNGIPRFMVSYHDAACQRHRRRCSTCETADALAENLSKEIAATPQAGGIGRKAASVQALPTT